MPTRLRCVDTVRRWAEDHLRRAEVDEDCSFAVQLALSEALTNVVRHSYQGAPDHSVPVELSIDAREVRVAICDGGQPFEPRAYEPPDLGEGQEGGYGLYLIAEVMDEVIRVPADDGTLITLIKRRTTERSRA